MRVAGIDHVVIRCRNLDEMIRFYRDVLGCAVEREVERLGMVHLRAGSALIDLVSVDGEIGRKGGVAPGAEGRNMDHFCLWIDPFDPDAVRRHFEALGIDVDAPRDRFGARGTGPSVYVRDPEGNTVELKGVTSTPIGGSTAGRE